MPEVGQGTLNPPVAQPLFSSALRTTSSEICVAVSGRPGAWYSLPSYFCDQRPMPSQQRFRSDDGGHLCQSFPAQLLCFRRESSTLIIIESEAAITNLL